MSSTFISETPVSTPDNFTGENRSKTKLIRTSTVPASNTYGTPPKSNELHRQMSASPSSLTTPVSAISSYFKNLLGMNAKTTKRSLSEEAECGTPESLTEWLRQGSDPNEIDAYGYTPLVNCSIRGCIKSAKILINNGADVNMKAIHGYCPLHAAAQNGYAELAELLIDSGADTEVKNDDGDTPLMLAIRSEHTAVVDLLCKRGCNMHTHGFDNIDPIDYAINKRNLYLSDVLMKHERQHFNSASSNEGGNNNNNSNNNSINNNNTVINSQALHTKSLKIGEVVEEDQQVINEEISDKRQSSLNDSVFQSD